MKVLELLDEIEDIIDTSSGFPLTGKILVDAEELLEIVREIRIELPDEIQQAQWIKDERQRILDEAKREYEAVLKEARTQAESLIENDDITVKAKIRADEIMHVAETNVKNLKMSTFDYIDSILYNFQDKMDQLNAVYFTDMFNEIQKTFDSINTTLTDNRNEIKDMIYKTQMENDH
ncbi:MAG: ATPase [Clostridiales bacterium]|nr:ATPase [Clostridiales bacterium]